MRSLNDILIPAFIEFAASVVVAVLAGAVGFCLGVAVHAGVGIANAVLVSFLAGACIVGLCMAVVIKKDRHKIDHLDGERARYKLAYEWKLFDERQRLMEFAENYFEGTSLTVVKGIFHDDGEIRLSVGDDDRLVDVDFGLLRLDVAAALEQAHVEWLAGAEE